jgi:hypothetical protein
MKTHFYYIKSILAKGILAFFSICLVSSLTLVSCSKDNDDALLVPIAINTAGVYVAGSESNGSVNVAKLWKDGVATNLSNGTNPAHAISVFVTNTDVYVAGYESNASGRWVAKLWKNGVATNLTDGTHNALANAVYVSGSDVYVAGEEENAMVRVAKVWKNGVATSLTDGTKTASANAITVSNGNVYVTGYEDDGVKNVAKNWKNGVQTGAVLGNNTGGSRAKGIAVFGSIIYSVGYQDNGSRNLAQLWTIGSVELLNYYGANNSNNAVANSACINNSNIFIAGSENLPGATTVAKYWVNGINANGTLNGNRSQNALSTLNSEANSIYVTSNDDVFVAGWEHKNGVYFATLWKNGIATTLSTSNSGSIANCVFVK